MIISAARTFPWSQYIEPKSASPLDWLLVGEVAYIAVPGAGISSIIPLLEIILCDCSAQLYKGQVYSTRDSPSNFPAGIYLHLISYILHKVSIVYLQEGLLATKVSRKYVYWITALESTVHFHSI